MIHVGQAQLAGADANLKDCIDRNWVTSGKFVKEFEELFADFTGARHAIAVMNGTAALHIILAAMGIGPGDEVIVPTLSYAATAFAVSYTGATPVFVDVDPDTWVMADVYRALTHKTKAILPVSLYGEPVFYPSRYAVVTDACEALGAPRVGTCAYSFYGNKTITTGEGGMVVTDDDALAERVRLLRNQGMTGQYWHEAIGFNYSMTDLQAAVGVSQMCHLPEFLARRSQVFHWYDRYMSAAFKPQKRSAGHAHWAYAVTLPANIDRDRVIKQMADKGIETRPVFYPMHTLPMYATGQSLPNAERIARAGIVLPTHPGLKEWDVIEVCDRLCQTLS